MSSHALDQVRSYIAICKIGRPYQVRTLLESVAIPQDEALQAIGELSNRGEVYLVAGSASYAAMFNITSYTVNGCRCDFIMRRGG